MRQMRRTDYWSNLSASHSWPWTCATNCSCDKNLRMFLVFIFYFVFDTWCKVMLTLLQIQSWCSLLPWTLLQNMNLLQKLYPGLINLISSLLFFDLTWHMHCTRSPGHKISIFSPLSFVISSWLWQSSSDLILDKGPLLASHSWTG